MTVKAQLCKIIKVIDICWSENKQQLFSCKLNAASSLLLVIT